MFFLNGRLWQVLLYLGKRKACCQVTVEFMKFRLIHGCSRLSDENLICIKVFVGLNSLHVGSHVSMLFCQLLISKLTFKKDLTGLQTARLLNNFESDQIQGFVGTDLLVHTICNFALISSHRFAGSELNHEIILIQNCLIG